ncbi:hypothetical protein EDC01DRAFT_188105 [Geopyxis carbonaria]|nr:hypothetical protein EDC01DRAFT_188105 [Geopyxis carbonaria]
MSRAYGHYRLTLPQHQKRTSVYSAINHQLSTYHLASAQTHLSAGRAEAAIDALEPVDRIFANAEKHHGALDVQPILIWMDAFVDREEEVPGYLERMCSRIMEVTETQSRIKREVRKVRTEARKALGVGQMQVLEVRGETVGEEVEEGIIVGTGEKMETEVEVVEVMDVMEDEMEDETGGVVVVGTGEDADGDASMGEEITGL